MAPAGRGNDDNYTTKELPTMRHLKVSLNRRQHLLTLSLCLLIGQLMMSTDATAIAWYGVGSPEICFSGKFTKEGNLKDDARLTVDIQEADLAVICDNLQDTGIKCQAGTGNTGGTAVDLDPETVPPKSNSNNQSF